MERYHDLIVTLIKANRKYPGCEDILDDIVADVYEHAEVVLNTVSNESVISSYLNKIVATSVITVSRRMGVKTTRTSANVLPTITNLAHEIEPESNLTDLKEHEQSFDTSEDVFEEIASEPSDEEVFEEISEDYDELDETETEETDLISEKTEEKLESEPEIQAPDVDKSLVDKMINGIPAEEDILTFEEEMPDVDTDLGEETLAEEEDLEVEEEPLAPAEEEEELPQEESFELEEESLAPSEEEKEFELDISEPEDELSGIETDLPEEVEVVDESAESDDLSTLEENETVDLEEVSELDDFVTEEEIEVLEEPEESEDEENASEKKLPSYDCFAYTPKQPEIDSEEIEQQINDIQSKHSDIDVFKIYKLKYQDKLSVDEIASELDLDDEQVLDILKDFVFIVKD